MLAHEILSSWKIGENCSTNNFYCENSENSRFQNWNFFFFFLVYFINNNQKYSCTENTVHRRIILLLLKYSFSKKLITYFWNINKKKKTVQYWNPETFELLQLTHCLNHFKHIFRLWASKFRLRKSKHVIITWVPLVGPRKPPVNPQRIELFTLHYFFIWN